MGGQSAHNHLKTKAQEREVGGSGPGVHKSSGLQQEHSAQASCNADGSAGNNGYHTQQQQQQRGLGAHEDGDSQPIHFVYDKDSVPAAASRDANAAWQVSC